MKTFNHASALRLAVILATCLHFSSSAQRFNSSDSVVYKLKNGKYISKWFADSLQKNRVAGPVKTTLPNGQIEIVYWTRWDSEQNAKNYEDTLRSWIGKPLRSFTAKTLDGRQVSSADLKGLTVLNFWYAGCRPCVGEMPDLNRLAVKYKEKGVRFLAFTFDDEKTTKDFLSNHQFDYELISDKGLPTRKMNVAVFPTHVLLKDGIVKHAMDGAYADIFERLSTMIDETSNGNK